MERWENKSGVFFVKKKIIPEGSIVHIVQRAPGRELLFVEESDYLYFLKLLKEVSAKFELEIFCFALMPNHFHLLTKFTRENASQSIKNLCERYAWFFNKKYKRKGHVFYGTFRAGLCLDDSYLLTSSLYIHLNPVKAKMVSRSSSYPWSSSSLYTDNREPTTFIKYAFLLQTLDNDIKKAKKIYTDLLLQSSNEKFDTWDSFNVVKSLRKKLLSAFFKINKAIVKNEFIDNALLEEKIKELSNTRRLRNPEHIKARRYLVQQLVSQGYSLEEIAIKFKISVRAIYGILRK